MTFSAKLKGISGKKAEITKHRRCRSTATPTTRGATVPRAIPQDILRHRRQCGIPSDTVGTTTIPRPSGTISKQDTITLRGEDLSMRMGM